MLVSYQWLQDYFDTKLPEPKKLAELLTFHSFEVEEILQKGKDVIFNIDILPNRASNCLSHRGIAKEVSVLLETPLKNDPLNKVFTLMPPPHLVSVTIDDANGCKRYSAAVLQGVSVGPSPDWLKERLEAIGQKPINNIVDATNFILFNIGQPLHAFDTDKLKKKDGAYSIVVRKGKKGEKITILNGAVYEVGPEDILITDAGKALIGIAGVKGGKAAEIDEKTKNIIIESAHFDSVSVRKTSQRLKLRTDASTRFENETPKELSPYGIREAVALILDIAGGKVEGYIDEHQELPKPYKAGIATSEVNALLGSHLQDGDIADVFKRFNFEYEKVNPVQKVLELAPTFEGVPYKLGARISYDAPEFFDCSSFISYLFVQGGISIPRMSVDQYFYGKEVGEEALQPGDVVFANTGEGTIHHVSAEFLKGSEIKQGIDHCGLYMGEGEVIHATRKTGNVVVENLDSSPSFKTIVGYRRMVAGDEDRFVVTVPFERLDLRIKEDLIEEIGRIYGYENLKSEVLQKPSTPQNVNKLFYYAEKIREALSKDGFSEVYTYSLKDKGKVELENPLASDKGFLRENLKDGIAESLVLNEKNKDLLGLSQIKVFEIGHVFSKSKEHISLCIGETKGEYKLQNALENLAEVFGISIEEKGRGDIAEIDLDALIDRLPEPKQYDHFPSSKQVAYKEISLYPPVFRDIALWTPKGTQPEEVLDIIKKEGGELLVKEMLFDTFEKDEQVSYAFRLVFQSMDKTLSDEEVNKVMNQITDILYKQKNWHVR